MEGRCTECSRPSFARGLCTSHYQRRRRERLGPEFVAWSNIIQRCTQPTHPAYPRYGGRGIGVHERYLGANGFENFLEDVGRRPPDPEGWTSRKAYWSVDRIDNNGHYEPGNLRWASPSEQALNRRPR